MGDRSGTAVDLYGISRFRWRSPFEWSLLYGSLADISVFNLCYKVTPKILLFFGKNAEFTLFTLEHNLNMLKGGLIFINLRR